MIYLDSGAVVKLVRQEEHSADLVDWLNGHRGTPLVTSALVEVEVARALRRAAPQALVGVPAVLARLFRMELDATIKAAAAGFAETTLRSLDAIHLATAQVLAKESGGPLTAFVSYDPRLLTAAEESGLPTASPGRDRTTAWLDHPAAPPAPTQATRMGYEWEHTSGWQLPDALPGA